TFTGALYGEDLLKVLNAADIGVSPDPKNAMNDISTMNKIMEYMTLEKPAVQFDLKEGRASAGEAALYARANDPRDFAARIAWLIEHPEEGRAMGRLGRRRVLDRLSWDHSVPHLLAAYDRIFARLGRWAAPASHRVIPASHRHEAGQGGEALGDEGHQPHLGLGLGLAGIDRRRVAHQRPVAAPHHQPVVDHRQLGAEVVDDALAALLEPVIDQLPREALLDHRAVDLETAVALGGEVHRVRLQAEDLPAADRQADLRSEERRGGKEGRARGAPRDETQRGETRDAAEG